MIKPCLQSFHPLYFFSTSGIRLYAASCTLSCTNLKFELSSFTIYHVTLFDNMFQPVLDICVFWISNQQCHNSMLKHYSKVQSKLQFLVPIGYLLIAQPSWRKEGVEYYRWCPWSKRHLRPKPNYLCWRYIRQAILCLLTTTWIQAQRMDYLCLLKHNTRERFRDMWKHAQGIGYHRVEVIIWLQPL